jgi:glycosyltransferase involved in cell wall biosynthesis
MVASWHTNLHEYSYRRLQTRCSFLPETLREAVSSGAEKGTLWAVTKWYKLAHFLAAPNQEMVDYLAQATGRPVYLMAHGVNTKLFAPERRNRKDPRFCIGYVGRLTPEKNVRALADLERNLLATGERDFRIVLVGEGSEREWLRANLRTAELTGVLRDEALATAFANMDAFVFPSATDTFGLVILEAMSSGVPVIVRPETGVRAGVIDGQDGFLSRDFAASVRYLMQCKTTRCRMGATARRHACSRSWSGVFDDLHRIYHDGLESEATRRRMPTPRF